ncbi:MAG: alpha/beta hydrolase [Lachnospiraceae bacterium]|nr:alpha/beta hydrolase [Lachnospiraceae bacterium]
MKTDIIRIDKNDRESMIVKATGDTVALAGENHLGDKETERLRLLTEETMELLKNLSDEVEASFYSEYKAGEFHIVVRFEVPEHSAERKGLLDIIENDESYVGIVGKLRAVIESYRYDESDDGNRAVLERFGIRKLVSEDVEDDTGLEGEAYLWSLQSYSFTAYDRALNDPSREEEWIEISRSIIANLADDIRLYIQPDHRELRIIKLLEETGEETKSLVMDPEFEALKKIPVATSRIQVRIVQLLYGRQMMKEASDDKVVTEIIKLPCKTSPRKELKCIVYSPRNAGGRLPWILFLHGGAFVFPALPYHYRLARKIADETGCRVFMPDYDLAPGHVPPIQHNEALEVWEYLTENSESLFIEKEQVGILGDSAGGTLCAALCLMLRDKGSMMPKGQALLYPSLDARLSSESMKKYTDVPVCNAKAVAAYYRLCSAKKNKAPRDMVSPVEAESLKGMPPTYVETAEFDCLHDDGIAYFKRLEEEGVHAELNETRGTVHAFDMAKDSTILAKAMKKRIDFLRRFVLA